MGQFDEERNFKPDLQHNKAVEDFSIALKDRGNYNYWKENFMESIRTEQKNNNYYTDKGFINIEKLSAKAAERFLNTYFK